MKWPWLFSTNETMLRASTWWFQHCGLHLFDGSESFWPNKSKLLVYQESSKVVPETFILFIQPDYSKRVPIIQEVRTCTCKVKTATASGLLCAKHCLMKFQIQKQGGGHKRISLVILQKGTSLLRCEKNRGQHGTTHHAIPPYACKMTQKKTIYWCLDIKKIFIYIPDCFRI